MTYSLNAMGNAIGYSDTLLAKADTLFDQSLEQVNNRVLENNEPDCITGSVAEQDELKVWIKGIPEQLQASTLIDYGEFTDVIQSQRADHNGGQDNTSHTENRTSISVQVATMSDSLSRAKNATRRQGMGISVRGTWITS